MTRTDDHRLKGRWPEFAVMSRRPGIGLNFLHEYASALMQFNLDTSQSDVPVTLRHGARELPLGRYARMRLRKLIGKDEKTPPEILALARQEYAASLQAVSKRAFAAAISLPAQLKEDQKTKIESFLARQKIHNSRRSL